MNLKAKVSGKNFLDGDGFVTTEHSSSSYGIPVVVVHGEIVDPETQPSITIHDFEHSEEEILSAQAALRRAGFVNVSHTELSL